MTIVSSISPIVVPTGLLNFFIFDTGRTSFNVRIKGHRGVNQFPQATPTQLAGSISEAVQQPYEWAQTIGVVSGGVLAQATLPVANDRATIVVIEVAPGQSIRYEFNTTRRAGGSVIAGNLSPRLSGINIFPWLPGGTISIIDAAVFP